MASAPKRKTSLMLDAEVLDGAKDLGINVSAVAEAALARAAAEARHKKWLDENADALAAQSDWHARNGPLSSMLSPVMDCHRMPRDICLGKRYFAAFYCLGPKKRCCMLPREGVIFAATGDGYIKLAFRAAKSLKAVCPDLAVDLFEDQDVESSVVDHLGATGRPLVALENRSDARDPVRAHALPRCQSVRDRRAPGRVRGAGPLRSCPYLRLVRNSGGQTVCRKRLSPAYPQFNSGMIAYRNTGDVRAFLHEWKAAIREYGIGRDQPTLRELFWDSDLSVAVLPEEYNLLHFEVLSKWWTRCTAPRIPHSPKLHQHIGLGSPYIKNVEQLIGPHAASRLQALLVADHTLAKACSEKRTPEPGHRGTRSLRTAPFRLRRWVGWQRFSTRRG